MHAVIVANGELNANARLQDLWQHAGLRLAADGGARNARAQLDLAPQVVIGDLDSLDAETRAWLARSTVEFIQHPVAKDETDLDLALSLSLARGAQRVTILGAFGGRIDHFMANVMLLARVPGVVFADAAGEVWAATEDATVEGTIGDTVSLIPISVRVEGLVTQGLQYPLRNETLRLGSTRGISNVLTELRATVHWQSGLLLVVHLFDGAKEKTEI